MKVDCGVHTYTDMHMMLVKSLSGSRARSTIEVKR